MADGPPRANIGRLLDCSLLSGPRSPSCGWSGLKYDTNLGGYVVNLDKRQLEGAPAYDVGEEPAWGDRAYENKIHDYYGVGPYWAR